MTNGGTLEPLAWDRQDLLRDRQQERVASRGMTNEGSNRCKSRVSAARAVVSGEFEVVQESQHSAGIQVLHAKILGFGAASAFNESQQKLERVPVRLDRPGAEPSLVHQVLAEVTLQCWPQQPAARLLVRRCLPDLVDRALHCRPLSPEAKRSKRPPAIDSSSAVPLRYQ